MSTLASSYESHADLTNCDREPIHIPGCIQPHGVLFVLKEPDFEIIQVSRNCLSFFNQSAEALLGQPLDSLLTPEEREQFRTAVNTKNITVNPLYLFSITIQGEEQTHSLNLIAHRHQGMLILEMEPATSPEQTMPPSFYDFVKESLFNLKNASSFEAFSTTVVTEIKKINHFDRVMLYQFDEAGHGAVVAEAREDYLEPYLGLHYPASDIPKQARELYLKNSLRFICDVDYQPVPLVPILNPQSGQPLDLSYAALRSVSPIHIEYLQNMQVKATMVISIIQNNSLWGLVACHHYAPHYVPYEVRTACELLGHFIALELLAREDNLDAEYRFKLQAMQREFIELMSGEQNLGEALVKFHPNLSDFIRAEGAAILLDGQYQLVGKTPSESQVRQLVGWLKNTMTGELFATHALSRSYPATAAYKDIASGMLAIAITDGNYVLWFRPEVIQTVHWAGDPTKPVRTINDGKQLTPRASFELWKEEVKLTSLPWSSYEIQAASEIRNSMIKVILNRTEALARTNEELERRVIERTTQLTATNKELEAFSYSVSHDLRAPLRSLDGYSQALLEDAGDRLTDREKTYIHYIREGSQRMGTLIEDLIKLSRITRDDIYFQKVDLTALATDILEGYKRQDPERNVDIKIADNLTGYGDPNLLKIMLENLLGNAWKFTQYKPVAEIEFGAQETENHPIYSVRDNGAGFKNKYMHKVFGAFQRLHRVEDFPGTGIGLATVQRVVHRHGGKIWAEAEVDQGATFYFTLNPELTPDQRNDV